MNLVPSRDEIQWVFVPPFDRLLPDMLARFLLQERFRTKANPVLEQGVALLLSETVTDEEVKEHEELALVDAMTVDGPMDLAQLFLSTHPDRLSPFLTRAFSLEFAIFIQSRFGVGKLLELSAAAFTQASASQDASRILTVSLGELETEWQEHCRRRAVHLAEKFKERISSRRLRPSWTDIPFQKGMSFSAEGAVRMGYLSEAARTSLDQLKVLRVEWISLMPFAFSSGRDGQGEVIFTPEGSWESDDSLRKAAFEAQQRGLQVFLKPHLWLGRYSTVELQIREPGRWHSWFASYRRYILHQARLAEEIHAGMFSIVNELQWLTLDPSHEADWRRLGGDVRQLYSGMITYCANWGEEFEKILFADSLDVLGLNDYYPLTNRADAPWTEMESRARCVAARISSVAARTGRPVIFTEMGYTATHNAAVTPWKEDPSSPPSPDAQAQALRVMLGSVWDQPWFRGIYWWKWYSHGQGGGGRDRSYMPKGKPVADVLREWYDRHRP